jgi:hypothetical protein
MHRVGDQTDEPVLLAATSFPLSPRAFYILYSLFEEGRNAPHPRRRPDLHSFFLARHHTSPPFLRTDPKVREKTISFQNPFSAANLLLLFFRILLLQLIYSAHTVAGGHRKDYSTCITSTIVPFFFHTHTATTCILHLLTKIFIFTTQPKSVYCS